MTAYSLALSHDGSDVLEMVRDAGDGPEIRVAGHWVPASSGDPNVWDREMLDVEPGAVAVYDELRTRRSTMTAHQFKGFAL